MENDVNKSNVKDSKKASRFRVVLNDDELQLICLKSFILKSCFIVFFLLFFCMHVEIP